MRISKIRILIIALVLVIPLPFRVFGIGLSFNPGKKLPSTLAARVKMKDLITSPFDGNLRIMPDVIIDPVEESVINFFGKVTAKEINLYFSLDYGMDFSSVKKGSCEIIKVPGGADGSISEIRFYIKDDSLSYAGIYPDPVSGESRMKIYLYGFLMQEDIKVPLPVSEAAVAPFDRIEALTSSYVDWSFYLPDPDYIYSDDVIRLSDRIIPLLKFLRDADDGAMDKDGNYVYIDTLLPQQGEGGLNCSGFAKWVIDGIYYTRTGSYTDITAMKKKDKALRGSRWTAKIEDSQDPFFGLDWTRNLADALTKTINPGEKSGDTDVKNLKFHTYVENVGYPLKDLKTILYELAVTSPDYFYLGSINMITEDPPGIRKHLHVVVLFPYIDSFGEFHDIVLSRNKKVSLKELGKSYPDSFIHLVKVKADPGFDPPGMKFDPTIRRF